MEQSKFEWTDSLVIDFVAWTLKQSPTFQGRYADIEQFKQSKQKQPILTTTDGVEIYDLEQTIYTVITKSQWEQKQPMAKNAAMLADYWKKFSTKEDRDKWVLLNKPCLSVLDVVKIFKTQSKESYLLNKSNQLINENELIELAKQKINTNDN